LWGDAAERLENDDGGHGDCVESVVKTGTSREGMVAVLSEPERELGSKEPKISSTWEGSAEGCGGVGRWCWFEEEILAVLPKVEGRGWFNAS